MEKFLFIRGIGKKKKLLNEIEMLRTKLNELNERLENKNSKIESLNSEITKQKLANINANEYYQAKIKEITDTDSQKYEELNSKYESMCARCGGYKTSNNNLKSKLKAAEQLIEDLKTDKYLRVQVPSRIVRRKQNASNSRVRRVSQTSNFLKERSELRNAKK